MQKIIWKMKMQIKVTEYESNCMEAVESPPSLVESRMRVLSSSFEHTTNPF